VSVYRRALLYTTDEQREMAELTRAAYQAVITNRGYGDITTQLAPASDFEYFYAEDHHQQYLYKVPNGYRCHANTGLALPVVSWP
jgi:peptide-methionine (S)-S-oxide reductase